jgi:hypothetical protein
MATKIDHTEPAVSKWDLAKPLAGFDQYDKGELVGKEFLITKVWFETNKRNINYAHFDGEFRSGKAFTTQDSGTGIRAQLAEYIESLGKTITDGEIYDVAIHVPRGTRVSVFPFIDEKGVEKKARTYYLTKSDDPTIA